MAIILPEIKKYNIGIGRTVISSLYMLAALAIIIVLLAALVDLDYAKSVLPLILIIPSLALMGFALYAFSDDVRGKLTIESDKLIYQSILKSQLLLISEIGGYRAYKAAKGSWAGKVIIIFPKDKNQEKITISQYIQNQSILLNWLIANFPNMDMVEHDRDEKNILQNTEFGATTEERKKNLAQALNVAIAVNVLGCLTAVGLFFLSSPFFLLTAVAYVPLSFLAAPWSKGIIYFNNKTNSAHPWIALGIIVSSIALMAYSLFNYSLLDYTQPSLWTYVSLLSIAMTVLMLMATSEFAKRTSLDIGNVIAFWLFLFMYSLGAFTITNCELDQSATQKLTTSITDKRVSRGKNGTDYYLKIKPVAPVNNDEIHVHEEFFSHKEVGDGITLYARQGRWGIPWYYFKEGE